MQERSRIERVLGLVLPAFFLSSVVIDWRREGWAFLAFEFVMGMGAFSVLFRPEAASTRNIQTAVGLMGAVLLAAGGWRHFQPSSAPHKDRAIATTLNVTPAEGGRGQNRTVTISATSLNFNETSRPNFGPDVSVLTTRLVNTSSLQTDIKIAAGAAIGHRRIWITTAGGQTAIDDSPDGVFQVVTVQSPDK